MSFSLELMRIFPRSCRVRPMSKILSLALIVSLTACFYGHPMMGVTPAEDDSAFDYTSLLLLLIGTACTAAI